jgi:hypothetical protein
MGSNMSHLENRRNRTQFSFSSREWSLRASHLLLTKLGEQYRKGCGKNLAGGRTSGAHSEAGCVQCKFQRRGGNKPMIILGSITSQLSIRLTLMAA